MGLWPECGEEIPSRYYQSVIKTVIRDNEGGAGSLFCCVIAIIEFQLNILFVFIHIKEKTSQFPHSSLFLHHHNKDPFI